MCFVLSLEEKVQIDASDLSAADGASAAFLVIMDGKRVVALSL